MPQLRDQAAGFIQHPSNPTGELRRRLIRAFLDENVRGPFSPHVVATAAT